jgi:5-methylcytosine-specific restriction endonuclease McrA
VSFVRRKRNAQRRAYNGPPIDIYTKLYLLDLHKGICQMCGIQTDSKDYTPHPKAGKIPGPTYPTIEHIIPVALGGTNITSNLTLACYKCNHSNSWAIENQARKLREIPDIS